MLVEFRDGSKFLSTPSARRATDVHMDEDPRVQISIHALREEGDLPIFCGRCSILSISIHALREEGDEPTKSRYSRILHFYPRPLRGERPQTERLVYTHGANFYPRPPRGGRLYPIGINLLAFSFLSTPSARRATAKTETKSLFSYKLYNILHEFRRALIYNGSKKLSKSCKTTRKSGAKVPERC